MLLHAMKHIAAGLEPRASAAACAPCAGGDAESEAAEEAEAAARALGEAMAEEAAALLPASGLPASDLPASGGAQLMPTVSSCLRTGSPDQLIT